MTTETGAPTLCEFLLARINEDEQTWRRQTAALGRLALLGAERELQAARAEFEAKRRLVALASWTGPKRTLRDRMFGPSADAGFQEGIRRGLLVLALAYATHPDYRAEWAQ